MFTETITEFPLFTNYRTKEALMEDQKDCTLIWGQCYSRITPWVSHETMLRLSLLCVKWDVAKIK